MDPPIGHRLTLWKSEQMPAKKRDAFRRLSFFRPPSIVEEPPPTILTTNTICRDFDPETGKKIINRFLMLREIGRGVHGKVKLAKDLDTGEFVAMKIIDKKVRKKQLGYTILRINNTTDNPQFKDWKRKTELKLRREIAILKKCAHPNIVRLKAVIDDPKSSKIYLALEYMEHGELIWREDEDSNKPMLTMQEARSIFRDVVSGLDYLHYQGIIHRDIKPANLLLSNDNTVKITDFGVSYFNPNLAGSKGHYDEEIDRDLTETAGTPAFFAPELCVSLDHTKLDGGKQNKHPITKAIDVWALGVTLYCLIYGRCPFTGRNQFELMEMIPKAPLVFPTKEEMDFETPASLKHLLEGLLCKNYKKRMTLEQVKHHPWVIEDLEDPRAWWKEADPRNYKAVKVTEDDVAKAVTVMDKLRKFIRRISTSLTNLSLVRLH